MARMAAMTFLLLSIAVHTVSSVGVGVSSRANPVRRVVNMLQMMQKKVVAEGEKEQELFDKFMCYCTSGKGDLTKAVEDATSKIPQVEADIEKASSEKAQDANDIVQHKSDRDGARSAMAEAKAIREKEADAFADSTAEKKANVAAMTKALAALEKGAGSSFLQSSAAGVLKSFVSSSTDLSDNDRDTLTSFLTTGSSDSDSDSEDDESEDSSAIVGILKQMVESMSKDLAESAADEEKAIKDYNGLVAAKTKESDALTKAIEEKTGRIGEVGVELVNMVEDLDDTKKGLKEDSAFLANLDKTCATKKQEWTVRQKTRSEELLALADTIKLLNDDDALDLFKKTLPSASFLQLQVTSKEVLKQARNVLRSASKHHHDARLDLIALALHGKKVSFDKILGMVDGMVKVLKDEQVADDEKKDYCAQEFDKAEDEAKDLARTVSGLTKAIAEAKESIDAAATEIEALGAGIEELDKQVAEATEQRQEENEEYKENLAANTAAKELISIAKNRMNKFYNPKMYKAPKLSEEDRITLNMGGTLAPTAPPSFVQLKQESSGAPPPPPETMGAYAKKSQESQGVLGMMASLISDLETEIAEMKTEEKNAQDDYEQFMADSKEKRSTDSKALADKEAAKADLEVEAQKLSEEKTGKESEAMANAKYTMQLHGECDFLIANFDTRKKARSGEIDSLAKAKSVLSGADFALVQLQHKHTRHRMRR